MHSGRTLGWSGRLDWPPPSPAPVAQRATGRHRLAASTAAWTPVPQQRSAPPVEPPQPAPPVEPPEPAPPVDPLIDTAEVGGLHKFDLGMVPASVTPPRTWQRAAWFAIGSSVAALGGLLFVSAMFAGSSSRLEGLELPSAPRGDEHPPLPDPYFLTGDPTRPQASAESAAPSSAGPAPQMVLPEPTTTAAPEGISGAPGTDAPRPSETAPPNRPAPPNGTTSPPTHEPPALLRLTDTEAMKRAGERYYSAIASGDLPGAYAMTGGDLRAEGYRSFAERYSFASKVEVLQVFVSSGGTVHELRLTLPDGSQRVERHALRYDTAGERTEIISDQRTS
ncbi:hypothetical protein [Saccharopolyspora griseoalba]|uniref:Serine/threonine protein kinase n=1 Tax=Saccharopolyspora griseoalba TaxID=1431848 RepID=A0ABW2LKD1_9PSEU